MVRALPYQPNFRALLFLHLFALSQLLYARDQNPPNSPQPINTDRPAFTDSSVVVPKESLQIENGFLDTQTLGQQSFDFPETLFRFGVAEKTELRFTAPDYYENVYSGTGFGTGWSDLVLGMKQQLGPIQGFDVSLVVSLSLPTGGHSVSSHGYDPEVQLPWSRKLSANWTAAGMLSVYWPTQGRSRNTTGQTTFLLDRQLTAPWDAFIEYAGDFPQRGGPEHILHFGTAYKLTPQQQLDFHLGLGLSSAAPDHFIGFGYSLLLRSLRH
jgi:Putative MetA-pathway of phenol degradation